MKKKPVLSVMPVLLLALALIFTACDNPAHDGVAGTGTSSKMATGREWSHTGKGSDGKTYTLTITELIKAKAATTESAYWPKAGDTYELTAASSIISQGTVVTATKGKVITLRADSAKGDLYVTLQSNPKSPDGYVITQISGYTNGKELVVRITESVEIVRPATEEDAIADLTAGGKTVDLRDVDTVTVDSPITLTDTTITGNGAIEISGSATVTVSGTVTVSDGATVTVDAGGGLNVGSRDKLVVDGGSLILEDSNGTNTNQLDGELRIKNGSEIRDKNETGGQIFGDNGTGSIVLEPGAKAYIKAQFPGQGSATEQLIVGGTGSSAMLILQDGTLTMKKNLYALNGEMEAVKTYYLGSSETFTVGANSTLTVSGSATVLYVFAGILQGESSTSTIVVGAGAKVSIWETNAASENTSKSLNTAGTYHWTGNGWSSSE